MGVREVKKELSKLKKAEMISLFGELYKKHKPVKEYLDFYTNPNEAQLLEDYKAQVRDGFFPKRGYKCKMAMSRKAIVEFKKLETSPESLADLLLYFVENGVEFTNDYGDIDDPFYTRLENTYEKALKLMIQNDLLDKFKDRAYKVVTETKHIGWGFHDCLTDLYIEHYGK